MQYIAEIDRRKKQKISRDQKKKIIDQIAGASSKKTQSILGIELGNPPNKAIRSTSEAEAPKAKTITPKKRNYIFTGNTNGCEYKNHKTGRTCGSQRFLEIDHIRPKWAQGSDEMQNLRVLCSAHNKYRYLAK